MKKNACCSFLVLFLCANIFCVSSSISAVARKTAVRYLKLAQDYLSNNDYDNALSQTEMGLAYDESVADLWYVKAAAKNLTGGIRAEIIPLVQKSLTEGEWVDYNRDGARILYADLLCDVGEYEQSLAVIDSEPFIYSADAEYIRAKSYYRQKTSESVEKARNKINAARKIYSKDTRFPHLFFKYEYLIHREQIAQNDSADFSENLLVQKIADSFIAKMPEYDNPDAELEILAVYFASGEKQKRMLQAFSAHGLEHPLFAMLALKSGLMSEQEAWDYFTAFSDKEVEIHLLEDMIALISSEDTIESIKEHLNSFNGVLLTDMNSNGQNELSVKYLRGRPENFFFDENNDGIIEWNAKCDFGVPEFIHLTQGNIDLSYGTYPAIVKADYTSANITFDVPDELFFWSPFEIYSLKSVYEKCDFEFFVVNAEIPIRQFDESRLIANCSSYEIPTKERENAWIHFNVLEGQPVSADYYAGNVYYAHTVFENGLPKMRAVDNTGDGIFETTEFFDYDMENEMNLTESEQKQLAVNLFGLPSSGIGIYVKMIQIDQNGDTIPDFSEEYLKDGGKISSWDFTGDGNWNVRYKKYPQKNGEPLVEDSQFYLEPEHSLVTITLWNGEPVKVVTKTKEYSVTQGELPPLYWVGDAGNLDDEYYVVRHFSENIQQGVSVILQNEKNRFLVVKIGNNIYAQMFEIPRVYQLDENLENVEEN